MILNKASLGAMFVAFSTAYNERFHSTPSQWEQIATPVPSSGKSNDYGWLGQYPRLREWIGDRQIKSMEAHSYSITNKKFESSVGIPRDDIDDDSYGVFTPLFQEMGFAAKTHPDELVFALLADGFTETCYDGQNFFDSDHPVADASVSNLQAGAGSPWFLLDTRRALKPIILQRRRDYALKAMTNMDDESVFMKDEFRYGVDARLNVGFGFWQQAFGSKAALDKTNFDAAYAAMMAFKSDEGRPLGINPNLLLTGPSGRAAALDVVKAERDANGATNTNRDVVEVLVVPWLA